MPTGEFTVDRSSRAAVTVFWNRYYLASENYDDHVGWTGDVTACEPGTTSIEFQNDTERRVNFFRAMAGLNSNVKLSRTELVTTAEGDAFKPDETATMHEAAQAGALWAEANNVLTHDPSSGTTCFSPLAWNGLAYSNIALNLYGPGAMDAYMREDDVGTFNPWNPDVGHRRWILYSGAQTMASGDIPRGEGDQFGANALYVIAPFNQNATPQWVAWPPSGYVPIQLNSGSWSISYPGADFSNTSVVVRDEGGQVVNLLSSREGEIGFGDSTYVWRPEGLPETLTGELRYTIELSGMVGTPSETLTYEVIFFDPNELAEDVIISGPANLPVEGTNYQVSRVEGAEMIELEATTVGTTAEASWIEGGESDTEGIATSGTADIGPWRVTTYSQTGDRSMRLAFRERTATEQWIDLGRRVVPDTNGTLEFWLRRGFLLETSSIVPQASTDGGSTWNDLAEYPGGTGPANQNFETDTAFIARSVSLSDYAGTTLDLRFLMRKSRTVTSFESSQAPQVGAFIDEVRVTNSTGPSETQTSTYAGNVFQIPVYAKTLGQTIESGKNYSLRARPCVGGRWYGYGPSLELSGTDTPLPDYDDWLANYPGAGGFENDEDRDGLANGLEYAFNLNPTEGSDSGQALSIETSDGELMLSATISELRSELTYAAEYSTDLQNWTSTGVTMTFTEGELQATVPMLENVPGFLRWAVSQ